MSEALFLPVIGILSLLVLDLFTIATRAAYRSNLEHLLSQIEQSSRLKTRVLRLLHTYPNMQSNLTMGLYVLRFCLVCLVLLTLIPWSEPAQRLYLLPGILLAIVMTLYILEVNMTRLVSLNPSTWAFRLAFYAKIVALIFSPIRWLVKTLLKRSNKPDDRTKGVTQAEIFNLVEASQHNGLLEIGEQQMIFSIMRLGDTLAREIMVPRIDILALDVETPVDQAVDLMLQSGHSRIPVYQDTIDNIQGLLFAKDLLRTWRQDNPTATLSDLMRPVYFVPEAKKVVELMSEMQEKRVHMAIVVDEYGGVAGLVTLEDIMEEIVGEIQDEYDQAEEKVYQIISDNEYIFLGKVDLDDFNSIMTSGLPKEEADTLGGYIYSQFGRVPNAGESLQANDLELTVEQVSGRRIRKVRARKLSPLSGDENGKNNAER